MNSLFLRFCLLVLITGVLNFFTENYLDLEKAFFNSFSDRLTFEQIKSYFDFQKKWQWVSYAIIPIFLLIKSTLVASVLYVGTFFYSKAKVTFKQLWSVAVKAEFVFLLVGVCKIVWFYFFQTSYTLEDLQYFYPFSTLNVIGYKSVEPWFIYPLQTFNLFELVYWLLLSYYIGKLAFTAKDKDKPMDLGFKIVASSYGSALLLWVVVVMFFTLNYS